MTETSAKTGTQTKQGDAQGKVAGHDELTHADVAPRSSRATVGLTALLVLILGILFMAFFLADEAPTSGNAAPAAILTDPESGLGN